MNDITVRQIAETQTNKAHKVVDQEKTRKNLKGQIQIVRKILLTTTWLNKHMLTDDIVYEISKFIFKNPISFRTLVFKHVETKRLKIDSKKTYILVNSNLEKQDQRIYSPGVSFSFPKIAPIVPKRKNNSTIEYRHLNCFHTGQYAINIKILKVWKSCKIHNENSSYKQIISKSKHFMHFLKNVKIDNPKLPNQFQDKYLQNGNIEDKEAKIYTLLCQNYDYNLDQISKIQQNQKHKKFDHSIAKAYAEMMNKNILILSVEKNNFNPISYKSEGKYIYFQNSLKLPLASQKFNRVYAHLQNYKIDKSQLKFIPYLQFNKIGEDWEIKNAAEQQIELFQEVGKQTDRSQGIIMDRLLNCYEYDDYVVKEA